ncbi:MAG TPA: outer membrane protein assembly factor BamD [Ignavibacteriaceae bacterium]|nr:outer membrane protein assembly factor BamD [Ignavibacteriaceae bacterium]
MNKLILLLITLTVLWGCSSSTDLSDLGPEDRLQHAIQIYNEEDYQESLDEFQSLILQYPGSAIVDDAQYYLGMTRYQRDEFVLAAYEFSKLIKSMPASEFLDDSQYMLAETYYELSPNYNLDQQYTVKAIEEFQAFIDFFPLNEKVAEAEIKINELNEKLARKSYTIALIYEKLEYYTASLKYFDEVVETYHDTPYASQALYSKIMLLMERERQDEALAEMVKFLKLFPEDNNAAEVEKMKESLDALLKGGISSN